MVFINVLVTTFPFLFVLPKKKEEKREGETIKID
jgi:hypothetical protein